MDEVTLPYGVVEVGDARCWGWTSVEFFGCEKWVLCCWWVVLGGQWLSKDADGEG